MPKILPEMVFLLLAIEGCVCVMCVCGALAMASQNLVCVFKKKTRLDVLSLLLALGSHLA